MIIKNKYNEIMKISLITKKEEKATIKDIVNYFQKYINDRNINISGEMPFMFTEDRAIMRNIEIKTPEECFNIYYNIINIREMTKRKRDLFK